MNFSVLIFFQKALQSADQDILNILSFWSVEADYEISFWSSWSRFRRFILRMTHRGNGKNIFTLWTSMFNEAKFREILLPLSSNVNDYVART